MQKIPAPPGCVSFPPSCNDACTHLILGSMPGVASLRAQQYYAHPQNRFWPLMARLLEGLPAAPAAYGERLALLLRHRIALWDALAACERRGSLDAAIQNERGNDFAAFLAKYPRIRVICFNGAKSCQSFQKYNRALWERQDLSFHSLPSTSPANARWSMDRLAEAWGSVFSPN